MFPCREYFPEERIRVFISSAQSNEGETEWSKIRCEVKDALSQCVYLNPFIIEDTASSTPSHQYYERQVTRADVIVVLIKGEVREGTAIECALANKLKKPMLIYFIKDDNPSLDVTELRENIQAGDWCTFRQVSDFNEIGKNVRDDIMNDIVRAFQDKYYALPLEEDSDSKLIALKGSELQSSGFVSKTKIGMFSSCYNYLFEQLDLSFYVEEVEKTDFHELGCSLLNWLVTGEWSIDDKAIIEFIKKCSDIFPNSKWLQKRWDAIKAFNRGDLAKALSYEDKALNLAREAKESGWIIDNILVDCCNIKFSVDDQNDVFSKECKYQTELSSKNTIIFLPILDRYLTNIYEYIRKDEFRKETATPDTRLFGSNMKYALTDLANYLFTAVIYGSNTHMQISRTVFAYILERYAKIVNDEALAFAALKQYVLSGNTKNFRLYIKSSWDTQYSYIASQADTIWNLSALAPVAKRDEMKQSVLALLGMYLTDSIFEDATEYIFNYSSSISPNKADLYFECLYANLDRMSADSVIQAIIPIIADKRFVVAEKLSHIILHIDLENVSESNLQNLAKALREQLPFIIERGGDPQMLSNLVERSRKIFGDLESLEGNGLDGLQRSIFNINLGLANWEELLKSEIEMARTQFNKNGEKNASCSFDHNPYSMIRIIIRKEIENDEIEKLIINDFIPHSIEVLKSEADVHIKETCVACLCEILNYFSKRNIKLPDSTRHALQEVEVKNNHQYISIFGSIKNLEIRVLMAKIIIGIVDISEISKWCIEFSNLESNEKITIIECLENYLFNKKDNIGKIDSLLISIVLQCSSEKDPTIRKIAIMCLAYLASSDYKNIAIFSLDKAMYDPSDKVRETLLYLCEKKFLPSGLSNRIKNLLGNDANYIIRKRASELEL